jgi:hypothetical protein
VLCGDRNVIIFEPDKRSRALVNGSTWRSAGPISVERLKEIERQGGSWADVLDAATATAAA